jgi:hypothetical protein
LYVQTEALRWQLKLRELQPDQPPSSSEDKNINNLLNSIAEIKKSIEVRSSFLSESHPISRALLLCESAYSTDWLAILILSNQFLMICLNYGCEQDLASKASATSNEISKLQQGQMDTVDVIGIMHEIVHDVAEVTLRDISAHKYKPTVKDIFHLSFLNPDDDASVS